MLPQKVKIDPRTASVSAFAQKAVTRAGRHERQDEVLAILAESRTAENMKRLTSILPSRPGLHYDQATIAKRASKRISDAFAAFHKYGLGKATTVLEIGCARAENAQYIKQRGAKKYIGLDIDSKNFPEENDLGYENQCLVASAENIPLDNSSVDFVVSYNVFEHIPSPRNALREIVRVLRPGGVFHTSFGPLFNSAAGPHLTRYVDLPFMHHLFPEEEVARFVRRNDAYWTVNRKSLKYYREQFFSEIDFRLTFYREQIDGRDFWLLKAMPSLQTKVELDEIAVCAITATVVKNNEHGQSVSIIDKIKKFSKAILSICNSHPAMMTR